MSELMHCISRSIMKSLNKPKQTINMVDIALLLMFMALRTYIGNPNTANTTCSCLAAISNMVVQSFCLSCWVTVTPPPAPDASGSSF